MNMQNVLKYKKPTIIVLVFVFVLFLTYLFIGFGSINIKNPAKYTAAFVDDLYVGDGSKNIKLRPGKYLVEISSPNYENQKEISVSVFSSNTIDSTEKKRNFTATVATAIAQDESNVVLWEGKIINSVWYGAIAYVKDINTAGFVVMKFENGRWQLVYMGTDLEDEYKTVVPNPVKEYFKIIGSSRIYGD